MSERTPQDVLREAAQSLVTFLEEEAEFTYCGSEESGFSAISFEQQHELELRTDALKDALDKAIAEAPDTLSEKPGLDVERLAAILRNADASMRDERGRNRSRTSFYWRDLAVLTAGLIVGEP